MITELTSECANASQVNGLNEFLTKEVLFIVGPTNIINNHMFYKTLNIKIMQYSKAVVKKRQPMESRSLLVIEFAHL